MDTDSRYVIASESQQIPRVVTGRTSHEERLMVPQSSAGEGMPDAARIRNDSCSERLLVGRRGRARRFVSNGLVRGRAWTAGEGWVAGVG